MSAPALLRGYKINFETLRSAFQAGDVALVSSIRKSDGKPVALVCAVGSHDDEVSLVPLAVMCEGNPFEDFTSPCE